MIKKKYVLFLSLVGVIISYVLMHPVLFRICFNEYTTGIYTYCSDDWQFFAAKLFGFPLISIFSLSIITYKMRDEMFQAWWSFAKWFVPIIIVITFFLYRNGESGGSGLSGIGSGFGEFVILVTLYALFIIISLVRICIAWYEAKTGKKLSPIKKASLAVFVPVLFVIALWYITSFF